MCHMLWIKGAQAGSSQRTTIRLAKPFSSRFCSARCHCREVADVFRKQRLLYGLVPVSYTTYIITLQMPAPPSSVCL